MKKNGFTFVEMIVVMVLLLVSGTVVMSVLNIQNNATRELTFQGKIHYMGEIVLEELERTARPSVALIGPGETYGGTPLALSRVTVDTLFIVDAAGTLTAGYGIANNRLWEYRNSSWTPFMSGRDTVMLMPNSGFELSPSRKEVVVQLQYMLLDRGDTITIPLRGGLVRCRN